MFKYLGQHIFDFVSQFRNDVYFKNLTGSSDTTALVVDADGKVHTNSLGSSGETEATKVRLPVRFQEAVVKGDPVYISGYNNGQDRAEVAKADCDDFSKMPSFGLADAAYSANDNGFVISIGNLADVDTQAYSVGDTLYVASGGGLTNVKPTVDAKFIQNVGVVTRSQQNSGQIEVVATGRTNDVPWPLYIDVPNSKVGIGTTNPSGTLHSYKATDNYVYIERGGGAALKLLAASNRAEFGTSNNHPFNITTNNQIGLTLDTSQRVGIGTTSPSFKLDVNAGTENVVASFSSTDQTAQLRIVESSNIPFYFGVVNTGAYISPTGATPADGISILNTGNVGIGIASPSVKLEIGTDGGGENKLRINSDVATKYLQFESLGNLSRIKATNAQNLLLESTGAGGYITFNANSAERMRILYDGKVGIGTTSPSEKLDVVGNIKASGTIKGKMEQMFACSFSDDLGTTKHFIPFTSNAEQTNVHADQVAMVMPYGGRVKCIQMRLSTIDADTTRTFGIESIAPGVNMFQNAGNWTVEETEAYELVNSDDYYLVNYVFSNETHFDSGDLIAISIQDSEDAYAGSKQTYVNVIIEYDLNNGMGNDTATTKYTS